MKFVPVFEVSDLVALTHFHMLHVFVGLHAVLDVSCNVDSAGRWAIGTLWHEATISLNTGVWALNFLKIRVDEGDQPWSL